MTYAHPSKRRRATYQPTQRPHRLPWHQRAARATIAPLVRAIIRAYWFTLSALLSIGVGFLIAVLFMAAVVGVAEILTGIGNALR